MIEVLLKAGVFIFLISLGYFLKRWGFFAKDDYHLVAKIVFNLTLPGAIISSFRGFQLDYSLLSLVLIGLLVNFILILFALAMTRKRENVDKILYIFTMAGYNIGNFTLPFVQSFLGSFGVVILCMFDVGNAIMGTGLTYAFTASYIGNSKGEKERFSLKMLADKLSKSTPFIIYFLMLILLLLNLSLPDFVYNLAGVFGSANTFLSMLMIGMMFEISFKESVWSKLGEIIISRYVINAVIVATIFYFQPFSQEVDIVLATALLAPSIGVGPIFVGKMGGNTGLASVVSSLTIVISALGFLVFFMSYKMC